MAYFEPLVADNDWRAVPAPNFIMNEQSTVQYRQEVLGEQPPTIKINPINPYTPSRGPNSAITSETISWPLYGVLYPASFVVAAVTGLFVVPAVAPDIFVGASLVAGYAAGALTYYLSARNDSAGRVARAEEASRSFIIDPGLAKAAALDSGAGFVAKPPGTL